MTRELQINVNGRPYSFPGTTRRLTIGRLETNDVRLGDPSASRFHAVLLGVGPHWEIRDLDSSSGTTVDGVQLRGEARTIRDGSKVLMGSSELHVTQLPCLVESASTATPPGAAVASFRCSKAGELLEVTLTRGQAALRIDAPEPRVARFLVLLAESWDPAAGLFHEVTHQEAWRCLGDHHLDANNLNKLHSDVRTWWYRALEELNSVAARDEPSLLPLPLPPRKSALLEVRRSRYCRLVLHKQLSACRIVQVPGR